ncbi:MAG: hypothetical protein EOP06_26410 [Proteobacteria bacterium]|nr:MAG: hypothetical protein EOP06_26410 [Pseudomonadota bacterium]
MGDVPISTGKLTASLLFAGEGKAVYIQHADSKNRPLLSQFQVADSGMLKAFSPQQITIEGKILTLVLSPTGRNLYVNTVHNGKRSDRFLVAFSIEESGQLRRVSPQRTETGLNAGLPFIDASGRYLYLLASPFIAAKPAQSFRKQSGLHRFEIGKDGNLKLRGVTDFRGNYLWDMVFVSK